jgi:5-methylthioadenosine/S-adenosylhomocysteine deaminase
VVLPLSAGRALGWDDEIGSLEVGKAADVIVHTGQAHLQPLHMPVQTLVYKASGQDVSTVIVAGRVLMRNRMALSIDESAVLSRAREEAIW